MTPKLKNPFKKIKRKRKCSECGAELSKTARMCPECGNNFTKKKESPFKTCNIGGGGCCLPVLIIAVVVAWFTYKTPLFQSFILVLVAIALILLIAILLMVTGSIYKLKKMFRF